MGTMQNKGTFATTNPTQRTDPAQRTGQGPSGPQRQMQPRGDQGLGYGGSRYGYSNPFSTMRRFMEQMDQMFEDYGGTRGTLSPSEHHFLQGAWQGNWSPAIEVFHEGEQLVVRADLPGMNKDNVHVEIQGDLLTISGERRQEHEDHRGNWFHSERSYGSFRRSVRLPGGADAANAEATFADGVLEVRMNAPNANGRKVEVRAKGAAGDKPKGGHDA